MADEKKEVVFEAALKRLETIVENLEGGEMSLDEALKAYEEGVRMADVCTKRLNEAEKRVEVLLKSGSGKVKTETFEDNENIKLKKKK